MVGGLSGSRANSGEINLEIEKNLAKERLRVYVSLVACLLKEASKTE